MKNKVVRRFLEYMYSNYIGNFIGFFIGMASTHLVGNFFTTRSFHNLWGLRHTDKILIEKKTYSNLQWFVALVIGFIVFEIVSKWLKKKMGEILPKYKMTQWIYEKEGQVQEPPLVD
jgi:hypothetical protein